jgi:hypothetical protein
MKNPDRIYLVDPNTDEAPELVNFACEEPYAASDDLYVRVGKAGLAAHWPADAEGLLRRLVAAMTGRTVGEVTEPLSRMLHELRYGKSPERPERLSLSARWCGAYSPEFGTCILYAGHGGSHYGQTHEFWP